MRFLVRHTRSLSCEGCDDSRHLPLDLSLPNDLETRAPARYINIGDWITHFSSAKIENGVLTLNT